MLVGNRDLFENVRLKVNALAQFLGREVYRKPAIRTLRKIIRLQFSKGLLVDLAARQASDRRPNQVERCSRLLFAFPQEASLG